MEKNSAASLLTSIDSLFTTQQERDLVSQPRVEEISLDRIDDFPDHPFKVRMDESMTEMADSVKQYGVLVPAIVRQKEDGRYEMVAGHRRKAACELVGKTKIPCVVRDLTLEEAVVVMVDSNLQREQILPSEKAFAYKMKLDAMKRQIGLYTDAACTQPITGSPFTTGADGTVLVPDLAPGTLYAKEVQVEDAYWVCDSLVKPVQIAPNQTASVTFTNTHYGNLRIRKNAVNGSPEWWNFQILDAAQKVIATLKTDADGYAYSDMLLPGQYTVRELHDRDETYWEYDAAVEKQVTVTAGAQAEVRYTNTQYGKIQIQKTMESEGSVQGWQFRITDATGAEISGSPFTTDARGLIVSGKLQPGTYTVEELIPEDSLYHCTSENPQTVTVKAGETAQVTFTNALRPGKITIQKVDSRGEPLAGATFLLEWSEDGAAWQRVGYTDSQVVTKGCWEPCSNPSCKPALATCCWYAVGLIPADSSSRRTFPTSVASTPYTPSMCWAQRPAIFPRCVFPKLPVQYWHCRNSPKNKIAHLKDLKKPSML